MAKLLLLHHEGVDRDALGAFLKKAWLDIEILGTPRELLSRVRGLGASAAGGAVLLIHENFALECGTAPDLAGMPTVVLGKDIRAQLPRLWVRVPDPPLYSEVATALARVLGGTNGADSNEGVPTTGIAVVAAADPSIGNAGLLLRGLSHALANPLAAAVGWVQILAAETTETDARFRAVRQIRGELSRLERFIQAIGLMGSRPLGPNAPIDLALMVADRARQLSREGIAHSIHVSEGLVARVAADPAALGLFLDLLFASILEERGRIRELEFRISPTAVGVELRIRDGAGAFSAIAPDLVLGDLLRNLRPTRALALGLAKTLAIRHGGRAGTHEPAAGAGAEFFIEFPTSATRKPAS